MTQEKRGKAVHSSRIKTSSVKKIVKEVVEDLRDQGSSVEAIVTTAAPIPFPIIIIDVEGYKQGIITNEKTFFKADDYYDERSFARLPDSVVEEGRPILRERFPDVKLFEYCRLGVLEDTFYKIYDHMVNIVKGTDSDRIKLQAGLNIEGRDNRTRLSVRHHLDVKENKVKLSIRPQGSQLSILTEYAPLELEYHLNHYEDTFDYIRNLVITDIKDIRSFRELAIALTQVTDNNFYTRSGVDLSPLKILKFPDLPKKEREWTPEDTVRLMPWVDVSVNVPRTATTLVEQLLLNISENKPGVEEGFKKFLVEEFGFKDNNVPIFDIQDHFQMVYGTIDTKLGPKKIEELTLAEVLTFSKDPEDVINFYYGTYDSFMKFIKSVNVEASCDGLLKRMSFNPQFLNDLREAVYSKVVIEGNSQGEHGRRISYYKQHTPFRYRSGVAREAYGSQHGAPAGYGAPAGGHHYGAPAGGHHYGAPAGGHHYGAPAGGYAGYTQK